MTISCIIPTLSDRPFMLAQAIKSAEDQNVSFKEIIVVNKPGRETPDNQAIKINIGIARSTADFYVFMGDDDILEPNFVENMTETFNQTNADIISSHFRNFGDEEGVHGPNAYPLCSTIVRRSLWEKVGGFPLKAGPAVDALFYFKCFDAGAKWVKTGDVLYKTRVHEGQYSRTADWELSKRRKKELFGDRYDKI